MSRCIPTDAAAITLGVDTHKDVHVGLALDGVGRPQGTLSVPANSAGYGRLLEWASGFSARWRTPGWKAQAPSAPVWPAF